VAGRADDARRENTTGHSGRDDNEVMPFKSELPSGSRRYQWGKGRGRKACAMQETTVYRAFAFADGATYSNVQSG
jgi:hypothetical protein